ncbi:Tyrosine recombinase XerC [Arenibacter antarcticus]|uniref:Phage integrase SAM-like domain-containing protein n=1 Tax=Arenibacter antarcticus TaxID=2040469 RepID=A0ABW5VKQ3_9FLAO|nr:site-specific integrase [Arenibacter sp. H213]MCM4167088.1 transposase [Arenibacter sp. H213]
MRTNITLSIDARRKRKDGTCPIIFRLSHHRKTITISTGFVIPFEYWNEKNREVKKTYKGVSSVSRLNNLLSKKKTELRDGINALEESGRLESLSITDLKYSLTRPISTISVFDFTQQLIGEMEEANRFGNAKAYRSSLGALKKFNKKEFLRFEEMTYTYLKRFETAHLKKGNSINGLSMYMRTFRAIYNKAINQGIVPADSYPFKKYKIKSEPTAKRAISIEKIRRILNLELEPDNPLFNARNYFLCSYLMNGISFIDMAFLKVENILDGRIQYRRQKTARHYDIKVTPQLSSIMDHYLKGKDKTAHIFPIVKRKGIHDQFKDIQWERRRYNKRLKEIAHLCGIEERLTSYVSRHSMATNLILNDVPINALSKMLGHSDISTTEIYIKNLPTHIMDEYQERLEI